MQRLPLLLSRNVPLHRKSKCESIVWYSPSKYVSFMKITANEMKRKYLPRNLPWCVCAHQLYLVGNDLEFCPWISNLTFCSPKTKKTKDKDGQKCDSFRFSHSPCRYFGGSGRSIRRNEANLFSFHHSVHALNDCGQQWAMNAYESHEENEQRDRNREKINLHNNKWRHH